MYFAKDMLEKKRYLENLGHQVEIPILIEECVINPEINSDYEIMETNNCMLDHFSKIAKADAILVLNHEKNGIGGYIGGSVLMEIGIARYLDKRIYILNELPSEEEIRYIFEVKITKPTILKGDMSQFTLDN